MGDFEAFLAEVRSRLERGRVDFEDRSLERPAMELITEIQEELADVCGWSAILWCRLERIREAAARVETETADTIPPPTTEAHS